MLKETRLVIQHEETDFALLLFYYSIRLCEESVTAMAKGF